MIYVSSTTRPLSNLNWHIKASFVEGNLNWPSTSLQNSKNSSFPEQHLLDQFRTILKQSTCVEVNSSLGFMKDHFPIKWEIYWWLSIFGFHLTIFSLKIAVLKLVYCLELSLRWALWPIGLLLDLSYHCSSTHHVPVFVTVFFLCPTFRNDFKL